jgi:hypothetical protein
MESAIGHVMLFLLLVLACSSEVTAPAASAAPTAVVRPQGPPPTTACLDKIDHADGATDHVVHKCANCVLVMDGDPKHASSVAGYTFHSCSDTCKGALDANPGEVVARACAHK